MNGINACFLATDQRISWLVPIPHRYLFCFTGLPLLHIVVLIFSQGSKGFKIVRLTQHPCCTSQNLFPCRKLNLFDCLSREIEPCCKSQSLFPCWALRFSSAVAREGLLPLLFAGDNSQSLGIEGYWKVKGGEEMHSRGIGFIVVRLDLSL